MVAKWILAALSALLIIAALIALCWPTARARVRDAIHRDIARARHHATKHQPPDPHQSHDRNDPLHGWRL